MPNPQPTQEEILNQYTSLPDELDAQVADLSASNFDFARAGGKWTIREIVHHIVDSDDMVKCIIMAALGNSGCAYDQSWYDQSNQAAQTLSYRTRPISPALALFRANHEYVSEAVRHIPDAWKRFVLLKMAGATEGRKITVGYLIHSRVHHAGHHFEQIRETREKHGM